MSRPILDAVRHEVETRGATVARWIRCFISDGAVRANSPFKDGGISLLLCGQRPVPNFVLISFLRRRCGPLPIDSVIPRNIKRSPSVGAPIRRLGRRSRGLSLWRSGFGFGRRLRRDLSTSSPLSFFFSNVGAALRLRLGTLLSIGKSITVVCVPARGQRLALAWLFRPHARRAAWAFCAWLSTIG